LPSSARTRSYSLGNARLAVDLGWPARTPRCARDCFLRVQTSTHFSVPALRARPHFLHGIDPASSFNKRSIFINLLYLDDARVKHRAHLESARKSREKNGQAR
jgi:hypothetical protein